MTATVQIRHRITNAVLLTHAGASLRGASLRGADLSGADLSWADLSGASLSGASLRGASLSWASLSWADLSWADLSGASLSGASLRGADLSGASLSGAKIRHNLALVGARPLLTIGPIGSESRTVFAWLTNAGLRIQAGCFFGSRDEFTACLAETHGGNEHAQEYTAALVLIDMHAKLWTPT
jgi:uncharacterized protein YjbI with pentapeptide repeats